MQNEITLKTSDWYTQLIEECAAILTERGYNARYELISGYFALGQAIVSQTANFANHGISNITATVAVDVGVSERTIWYAVQFAQRYPTLDAVLDNKAVSWTKICRLIDGKKPNEKCLHEHTYQVTICSSCQKKVVQ